jgi:hypothetical protein
LPLFVLLLTHARKKLERVTTIKNIFFIHALLQSTCPLLNLLRASQHISKLAVAHQATGQVFVWQQINKVSTVVSKKPRQG